MHPLIWLAEQGWQVLATPFHSARLAAIDLTYGRLIFEARRALHHERTVFRDAVTELCQIESDLAEALDTLTLPQTKHAALLAYRAQLMKIEDRFTAGAAADRVESTTVPGMAQAA